MNKSRKESHSNRNPLKRNPSRSLSKRNQPKASHSQVFHCLPHPIPAILLTGLLLIGCGYNTQKSAAPAAVTSAHAQPSSPASAKSQTGNPKNTGRDYRKEHRGSWKGEGRRSWRGDRRRARKGDYRKNYRNNHRKNYRKNRRKNYRKNYSRNHPPGQVHGFYNPGIPGRHGSLR